MVNEYKKIVLLIGLEAISDYHFRLIKSLLAKDLKLTRNMQDDYDRIQIADLMEEKFQSDAGLRKLIAVCRDIPALADLAETLEKRRLKVKGKSKGKKKSTVRKVQQDEPTTAPSSSRTNTDLEAESKEERPLSKENEDKKSEDPEGMQLPLEQSQFLAPSATSKQQTEGCSQTPHGPPPTPPSTPPIKEMDDTNKQTHDNMKVQESQGQRRLPELSEVGTQTTVSMFRTSHMSPRKPSGSLQTPRIPPTAPPSSLQTPRIPPTAPSSSLQTPQIPPTAPSSSLQTPQIPPTAPSSSLQTPQIPPTAPPSSLQTPRIPPTAPSSSLQTPQIPPTAPSSSLQTPQIPPTAPSSSLQTPQIPPTAPSGKTHTTHLSPTSSREIQTPHLNSTSSLMASSRMPTPHLSPTSSSRIQTPQVDPAIPPTTLQTPLMTPTSFSSCSPKNPRLTTIPKDASIECGYKKGPKEVMVLKATEPFTYEFKECEKRMFHATVATESEFFRVKVFDITLKEKFIPKKVIAISDYIGRNGFLEIYGASSVSDVSANRKMEISYRLVQNANATPKIEYLCSQCPVKYVNGVYTVYKKNVREDCTYYEIRDNTGQMEVVVHRRLMYINCEEGDKLKLFCFELTFNVDKWQLRSVTHSYIKVIKARKLKIGPLHPDSNMETSQDSP